MTHGMASDQVTRPHVLLAGDAGARPQGLERALSRAGFLLVEVDEASSGQPVDAVLLTVTDADPARLRHLLPPGDAPPRIVLVASGDPEAPVAALAAGADDALALPVHLPELCARLHARIRDRQMPRGLARELASRSALATMVEEIRGPFRPDEVVLTLVRRVARAFELRSCAFVAASGAELRLVAAVGAELRPEPARHPAVAEVMRTGRPATWPGEVAARTGEVELLALPAQTDEALAGVLLLCPAEGRGWLSAGQVEMASAMAAAAARALRGTEGSRGGHPGEADSAIDPLTGCPTGPVLDRRLGEEFERARRYALSFSLILLDVDALAGVNERLGLEAGDRLLRGLAARVRSQLRLPDLLCRYGGDEFAIVLPETGIDGALRSVARIREALSAAPLDPTLAGERPRVSAGVVTYPHPAADRPDDLVALVEAGLARAKGQSGERVGIAE
ncbi:MAG: GGDEF domain-containing protein [Gemmatimonadales bacterium]